MIAYVGRRAGQGLALMCATNSPGLLDAGVTQERSDQGGAAEVEVSAPRLTLDLLRSPLSSPCRKLARFVKVAFGTDTVTFLFFMGRRLEGSPRPALSS